MRHQRQESNYNRTHRDSNRDKNRSDRLESSRGRNYQSDSEQDYESRRRPSNYSYGSNVNNDYSRDTGYTNRDDFSRGDFSSQDASGRDNYYTQSDYASDRNERYQGEQDRTYGSSYGADYDRSSSGDSYGRNSSGRNRDYGSSAWGSRGNERNASDFSRNMNSDYGRSSSDYSNPDYTNERSYGLNAPEGRYAQGYTNSNYTAGSAGDRSQNQSYRTQGEHYGRGPKNYKRSDERIREDVCEALYNHPRIDASEIEVSVQEGVVTLSGTVEERQLKRLAEDTVESCSGVTDVKNDIKVVSSSSYGSRSQSQADKTDKTDKSATKTQTRAH